MWFTYYSPIRCFSVSKGFSPSSFLAEGGHKRVTTIIYKFCKKNLAECHVWNYLFCFYGCCQKNQQKRIT